MSYSKKKALSIVFRAATEYKENLAGSTLLFVSLDKHHKTNCVEATFSSENFLHLTGFETKLSSKHFFSLCCDKRLSESDFEFRKDGTTDLKLEVLPKVVKKDLSARMIGDPNGSRPFIYLDKLVGGTRSYVGFEYVGEKKKHIPKTLINGDLRKDAIGSPDRVVLICRKKTRDALFGEIVYKADEFGWDKVSLPVEYSHVQLLDQ